MGCFTVKKSKKKKSDQFAYVKRISRNDHAPSVLPEPQTPTRSLQSAPPSFRTRVKPIQPVNNNKVANNRARALSAPSTLDAADQDDLASIEYEEQEESRYRGGGGSMKEQRSASPQPLPLPSPQGGSTLKAINSFKMGTASGPLHAFGPLPLPPTGSLRNFPYEEVAAACHNFSSNLCIFFQHFNNPLDTFSVNTVINFYCNRYVPHEAVGFYFRSLRIGLFPNSYTFVPLIGSCSSMGCFDSGGMCHAQAVKNGVDFVVQVL